MIEDLQHKMSFIEGLIYTFNEENAKLPNVRSLKYSFKVE